MSKQDWTPYVGAPSVSIKQDGNRVKATFNVDALRILGAKRTDKFNISIYFKGRTCAVVPDDSGFLRITGNGQARGYGWLAAGWPLGKCVGSCGEFNGKQALILARPKKAAKSEGTASEGRA